MATQLQNRLVGTAVLAAIGVIFLPTILDGEKVSHQDTFVTMPEKPKYKPEQQHLVFDKNEIADKLPAAEPLSSEQPLDDEPIDFDAATEQTSESETGQQQSESEELNDVKLSDELPVDDRKGSAWVIQLGSFRHNKNVDVLLKKLRSQGFVAFTRPIETTSGTLTKVFVGPDLSRDKLEAALPKLKRLTNLNGKVTSFMMDR